MADYNTYNEKHLRLLNTTAQRLERLTHYVSTDHPGKKYTGKLIDESRALFAEIEYRLETNSNVQIRGDGVRNTLNAVQSFNRSTRDHEAKELCRVTMDGLNSLIRNNLVEGIPPEVLSKVR